MGGLGGGACVERCESAREGGSPGHVQSMGPRNGRKRGRNGMWHTQGLPAWKTHRCDHMYVPGRSWGIGRVVTKQYICLWCLARMQLIIMKSSTPALPHTASSRA